MTIPAALPGWWDADAKAWREDAYQAGSPTGPIAWAMLLWLALDNRAPAELAAGWIVSRLRPERGYEGGFYGFEPDPIPLTWRSTEQNTDLFAAFRRLGLTEPAAHAADFVHAMFNPDTRLFNAGTTPEGKPNPLLAADAGIWPYLAGLGTPASALAAIERLRRGDGIGFSEVSRTLWPEGTAFAALSLKRLNPPLASRFEASVAAERSAQGFVYSAADARLATGFAVGPPIPGQPSQAFLYYRRPALAPTAWAALCASGTNPLST
jgi:hypothetical protein